MPVDVQLTPAEMMQAAMAGAMRQVENTRDGKSHRYGADPNNGWQLHIEGAMGECALAKCLGIYWPGKGRLRDFDVGSADVRTSPKPSADLRLHPTDPDDRRYYLVTGANGSYRVHGSLLARDGKQDRWWYNGPRPCYFVPQSELEPIND